MKMQDIMFALEVNGRVQRLLPLVSTVNIYLLIMPTLLPSTLITYVPGLSCRKSISF